MSRPRPSVLRNSILVGDVRKMLSRIPTASIDTIITSPPYFRLRNYQHDEQIGLEQHVDGWVDELRTVARGLARVLKPTGSMWLNLGDTYARHATDGAAPKSLVLAPERVALALQRDGWILRNKIIWAKPNPMPTSVRDRLSCTYEVVYFFTRSKDYFFDLDAIRIPHRGAIPKSTSKKASWSVPASWRGPSSGSNGGLDRLKAQGLAGHPLGKNPGDVWTIPTAGYRGAHHAVFPQRLVERPLMATCPLKICTGCAMPWKNAKDCTCPSTSSRPGIVLDPFFGSGTVGIVAERLGREWLGVELNPDFARLAVASIDGARSDGPELERTAA